MRVTVFGGGDILLQYIKDLPESDLVICADSGYENARALGVKVDVLVGDLDSITRAPDGEVELIKVPAQKDMTDTQLAVQVALERGAREITIIASTSGRVDHTLSLMAILEQLCEKRIPAVIINGQNRIRFIRDGGTILVRSEYKYFSLITLDRVAKKVSVEGGKYPLQ